MSTGSKKRETFSSGIAVFFATLGSAVGLGNIWKFPYSSPKLVTVTKIYLFVLKTITPVLLIIIFLNSIGIINFK